MAHQRKPSNHNRPFAPLLVLAGGVLILITALYIGLAGQPQIQPTPPTESGTTEEIERVSLADALAAYNAGSAVFIDVRAADSYTQRHIPKALNIPLNEIAARAGELDPKEWIITY